MGLPWLDKYQFVSNNYVTYLNDILTVALFFTANLSCMWKSGGHPLQKKPLFEDCKAKAEK